MTNMSRLSAYLLGNFSLFAVSVLKKKKKKKERKKMKEGRF